MTRRRVTIRRLSPPLVEVDIVPPLLSRLLAATTGGLFGRRSRNGLARQLYTDSSVWVWLDDLRVVDDETHAAIVDAVTDARLQRRLRTAIAAGRRDYYDALYDDRLN